MSACHLHTASMPSPIHAAWLRLIVVLLVAATALSCSQKTLPAYGEVLLLLSSDMPVPESFDTVILTVDGKGRAFRAANPKDTNTVDDCRVGIGTATPLSTVELRLPTTIALTSEHDEAQDDVKATLTACKDGQVVFRRDFVVDLPQSGQVRMLRAPIRWLCNDRSQACYGCGSATSAVGEKACYHRDITRLTSPAPGQCEASECVGESDIYEAVSYDESAVAHYAPDSTSCFDPWGCFDMSEDSQFDAHGWTQVATGWQQGETDAGTPSVCVATLDSKLRESSSTTLNVALVLPAGSQGFCTRSRCFVPLDRDSVVGWTELDHAKGQVFLPAAVCHMLDSGQVSYVVAASSPGCIQKAKDNLICNKYKAPTTPEPIPTLVTFPKVNTIYLPLDEPGDDPQGSLSDSQHIPRLQRVTGSNATGSGVSTDIAVIGRAGRFNSQTYAQGRNTNEMTEAHTFSAWVSLTELPTDDAALMPILSNVFRDCSSGVRLSLRTCANDPIVYVALGLPNGVLVGDRCQFEYKYARLTGKSYQGGYFDPWKIGTYYHVAATLEAAGQTHLYVDGNLSDLADPPCGYATTGVEASDLEWFVLGSQVPLATSQPISHDILIDEVALFAAALEPPQLKRLIMELSTIPGASGLRWGPWATQGSTAQINPTDLLPQFSIVDKQASSAGAFALLETTDRLLSTQGTALAVPPNLADFDEAVLVVDPLPASKPFQFALVADHGRQQCTWQLRAVPAKDPGDTSADTYVINLRSPSWCVDPNCRFELAGVERASIGSTWLEAQQLPNWEFSFKYTIRSLVFRKRPEPAGAGGPKYLGGVIGPSNWCWKSISYAAEWEVLPVKPASLADARNPVIVDKPTLYAGATQDLPELAADLPDDLGSRDMSACQTVRLGLVPGSDWNTKVNTASDPRLALTSDLGQTCNWQILGPINGYYEANLTGDGSPWNPPTSPSALCKTMAKAVTRLSVRYTGSLRVNSVECCRSPGDCIDIGMLSSSMVAK